MSWSQHTVTVEEVVRIVRLVPPAEWLSIDEQCRLARFRDKSASLAWLGGRWCVKQLLRSRLRVAESQLCRIHVESRNGRRQGVRPWIFLDGRLKAENISLAHSSRLSTAVLLAKTTGAIGVDISSPRYDAPRIPEFWFTNNERAWCNSGIAPRTIWSLKEAIYKATNQGESFQPRTLDVTEWLSVDECGRVSSKNGTVRCARQGAEFAWHTIRESTIIVAAISHLSAIDTPLRTQHKEYSLAS